MRDGRLENEFEIRNVGRKLAKKRIQKGQQKLSKKNNEMVKADILLLVNAPFVYFHNIQISLAVYAQTDGHLPRPRLRLFAIFLCSKKD